MNEADSEKLAAGLAKLGWEEAAKANEADLAVVNTCVVRQKAEDRAAGYLGLLRKLKESRDGGLQIAVMGCMVGPRTDDLRSRFPYVDVWAPAELRGRPAARHAGIGAGRRVLARYVSGTKGPDGLRAGGPRLQ